MTEETISDWLFQITGPAARGALREILKIHVPRRIYDECEHEHAYDEPGLIDTGDFMTCADGYMYSICKCCCTSGWDFEQTEDCASDHKHSKDTAICPTVAAIEATPC